jgi:hypothetical protein
VRRRTLIRDAETALEFAVDAYVYLYPLVLLDLTRRRMTNGDGVGHAPVNTFAHVKGALPPDFRDVVRPSFDTLHSLAWLDLRREPVVVSLPDGGDRYYLLPVIDMWSDLVAVPGTRTGGNWPTDYAVVGPGWTGELPEQVKRIDVPTPYVWVVGRIWPGGAGDDGDDFQAGLAITPLSRWRRRHLRLRLARRRPDDSVDLVTPPVEQVAAMPAEEFFCRGAELLRLHPPHVHDHAVLERSERIGLVAGRPFDPASVPRAVAEVLPAAAAHARFELDRRSCRLGRRRNGWQLCADTMGTWGTDYVKRAAVARDFLGAVMPEDVVQAAAFVDGAGLPLDGAHEYTLRFAPHEQPPVRAFWSLTAYDQRGYVVANAIDRYTRGSQDALERACDGPLELTIQHSPPSNGTATNWLPCPAGRFNLCLRLYRPEPEALDDTWIPPPLRRREGPVPARTRVLEASPAS